MRYSLTSLFWAVCGAATVIAIAQGNLFGLFVGGSLTALFAAAWAEAKFGD